MFRRIIDQNPSDDGAGNGLLGNIQFSRDYFDSRPGNELACTPDDDTPPDEAEMREFKTDHPKIILCEPIFTYGVIGRQGYPNAPGVTCDNIYPRISHRMETFGHNLLHEYTHWDKLLVDIVQGPFDIPGIEDVEADNGAYGCWAVRQLDRPQSQRNADSYAWLATKVFWTQTCFGTHGPLQEPRKEDNA